MTSQVMIQPDDVLLDIHEGMAVFDRNEDKVGTVRYVRFGDDSADDMTPSDDSRVDHAPRALRTRMLQSGFFRINNGLLRRDCYATPDIVSRVDDEGVHLNVAKDLMMTL
ncbi:MAG: hypothetical protein IT320_07645 [Anaerolineae bacterium]|nr:hypothetical protein [Anaerolineae bacterium]